MNRCWQFLKLAKLYGMQSNERPHQWPWSFFYIYWSFLQVPSRATYHPPSWIWTSTLLVNTKSQHWFSIGVNLWWHSHLLFQLSNWRNEENWVISQLSKEKIVVIFRSLLISPTLIKFPVSTPESHGVLYVQD